MTVKEIYYAYFGRRDGPHSWLYAFFFTVVVRVMPFSFFWERTWLNPWRPTPEELKAREAAIIEFLSQACAD